MTLIALIGKKRAGKDTFARCFLEHGFERRALADPIRSVLYDANPPVRATRLRGLVDSIGWEAAKSYPEVRSLMQNLGHAVREHVGESVWIDALARTLEPGRDYVITDARYPNEIEFARSRGGLVIEVRRTGVAYTDEHISENAWTSTVPDHVVYNNGPVSDLEAYAAALVAAYA